ncbi:MAG TPA: tRNA (adenosine(37)-N6)-threonylcarbamoyltransferase complex dimerization subunit type 1 TsaB, partial [Planctomycetota bacterium]|nr:tRNA (adenosine(37)-N6)-threonylcarbamoyltransferase complex dimerization subunit type 1 TsaB [Planctomycetota bacterium]
MILALDTSCPMGSVALRFPDASTVEKIFPSFSEGGGDVGSMVRGLLREHSLKAKDIGVGAVGIGPRSCTGTRV